MKGASSGHWLRRLAAGSDWMWVLVGVGCGTEIVERHLRWINTDPVRSTRSNDRTLSISQGRTTFIPSNQLHHLNSLLRRTMPVYSLAAYIQRKGLMI